MACLGAGKRRVSASASSCIRFPRVLDGSRGGLSRLEKPDAETKGDRRRLEPAGRIGHPSRRMESARDRVDPLRNAQSRSGRARSCSAQHRDERCGHRLLAREIPLVESPTRHRYSGALRCEFPPAPSYAASSFLCVGARFGVGGSRGGVGGLFPGAQVRVACVCRRSRPVASLGGIHYRSDKDEGLRLGRKIGERVAKQAFGALESLQRAGKNP